MDGIWILEENRDFPQTRFPKNMRCVFLILLRAARLIWAGPNTLLGILAGCFALASGGGVQICRGCVEFHGGVVRMVMKRLLGGGGASAITFGHCILGQTIEDLAWARNHEHVHVRQYERWGPFFIPAYLAASAWQWSRGRNAYLDNPFEVEAYAKENLSQ